MTMLVMLLPDRIPGNNGHTLMVDATGEAMAALADIDSASLKGLSQPVPTLLLS